MKEASTKILNKIYEDRKQRSDDMMYFYETYESTLGEYDDCIESFGMTMDEVLQLIPEEFKLVVCGGDALETYGDFEKVYEAYFNLEAKSVIDIVHWIKKHNLETQEELRDWVDTWCDGSDYWCYPIEEKEDLIKELEDLTFEQKYVLITLNGESRYWEYNIIKLEELK